MLMLPVAPLTCGFSSATEFFKSHSFLQCSYDLTVESRLGARVA